MRLHLAHEVHGHDHHDQQSRAAELEASLEDQRLQLQEDLDKALRGTLLRFAFDGDADAYYFGQYADRDFVYTKLKLIF